MKMKIRVVVNPISGIGRQKKIETVLKTNLNQDIFDYEVCYTERIHHGTELAREAADKGYDCVVAVGGDGSVNDVVTGIYGTNTRLGIIPCGSGNGLARCLKIPLVPALAVRALNQCHEESIDVMTINDKYVSVNLSGVGFDAYIARLMKAAKSRGFSAYMSFMLREYATYQCNDYQLTIDGRQYTRNAWLIAFANSNQFGYNAAVAPLAKLDDGLIDVVVLDKIPIEHLALTVPLAYANHFELSQHCEMFKAKDILVEGNIDKWVNIDGEAENLGTSVHFVNHHQALNIYSRDITRPIVGIVNEVKPKRPTHPVK
ncbi:MAG: diacylglycerol kinase family lipid kinase [Bacteroidales bacterium]|nr:diacylglycerol kinase family lipid kinase [Bacteroidales bacterium]